MLPYKSRASSSIRCADAEQLLLMIALELYPQYPGNCTAAAALNIKTIETLRPWHQQALLAWPATPDAYCRPHMKFQNNQMRQGHHQQQHKKHGQHQQQQQRFSHAGVSKALPNSKKFDVDDALSRPGVASAAAAARRTMLFAPPGDSCSFLLSSSIPLFYCSLIFPLFSIVCSSSRGNFN